MPPDRSPGALSVSGSGAAQWVSERQVVARLPTRPLLFGDVSVLPHSAANRFQLQFAMF